MDLKCQSIHIACGSYRLPASSTRKRNVKVPQMLSSPSIKWIALGILSLLSLLVIIYLTISPRFKRPSAKENQEHLSSKLGFWSQRGLFFVVSPGRAGSKYMSHILGCADDVLSFHEPEPKMNAEVLSEVIIKGNRKETLVDRLLKKVDSMVLLLEGSKPTLSYAESSHMFIKTFYDVILSGFVSEDPMLKVRLGLDLRNESSRDKMKSLYRQPGLAKSVTIIILRRNFSATVLSQANLGWFTKKHSGRDVWYYSIKDAHPSERILSLCDMDGERTDFIDEIIGYNFEIEARAQKLVSYVKGMAEFNKRLKLVEVDLESLSNMTQVDQFLRDKLGLEPNPKKLNALEYKDINARNIKKEKAGVNVESAQVDAKLERFFKQYKIQKKCVPVVHGLSPSKELYHCIL